MAFDKVVCYIYNNICTPIVNKTFGDYTDKQKTISLNDFIAGTIITIVTILLLSWWLIPLRYIRQIFVNYTKDIVFVCPKEENK